MSTLTKDKFSWFGVLKMSGLLVSEVVYRDHFERTPPVDVQEWAKVRKRLDQFNSGTRSVNDLVKALFYDVLNHQASLWKEGRDAASFRVVEPDHQEALMPNFVLLSEDKKSPGFVVKTLDRDTDIEKRKPAHSGVWRASEHLKFETLLRLLGCPLGLLTNGDEFRLVYVEQGLSAAFISWKQSDWIEEKTTFEAFRNLLHANTLLPNKKKGLHSIVRESHEKQAEVTDALADQVYLVINNILEYINQSDIDVEADKIYEVVIKVVMRLVFILYAEENSLLPHGLPEYDDNYGLIYLANSFEAERSFLGESDFESASSYRYDAWFRILALFNLIYFGSDHPELKITAHGGDLFSPEGIIELLKRIKLNNKGIRDILHALLYMKGLRLSYAAIDVEQIGYVYEGLLGHTVSRASEDLVVTAKEKFVLPLSELEKRSPEQIKVLLKEIDSKIKAKSVPEKFPEPVDNSLRARVARYAEILAPEEERLIRRGNYYMAASGARKSTGSYYTPKQLTTYLVKETLGPLCVEESAEEMKSSQEILGLKVVDPAMGSGAFLVQVTNFLAERLVKAWELEGQYTELPDIDREILAKRSVAEHCVYGVDINPTAVELAKMSLWLNTFAKDKPFTFLDHKLKCGNSLIGVFHGMEDMTAIPPEVYKPSKNASGHWKKRLSELRRINSKYKPTDKKSDARMQSSFSFLTGAVGEKFERISRELSEVSQQIDVTGRETEDYFAKEKIYKERFLHNKDYTAEKMKADVWAAQWFANEIDHIQPLTTGELQQLHRRIESGKASWAKLFEESEVLNWVESISKEQRFFHWKLEFPDVFLKGGFDAVVGNPPWEVLKLKEREYFAGKDFEVFRSRKTNERRSMIEKLKDTNLQLHRAYTRQIDQYSLIGRFISSRGLFSLTSKGELNTYQLFAELFLRLRKEGGRSGVIVPTGIATDKSNSTFFRFLVENKLLWSLADFVNGRIFKNIDSRMRFSLIIFGKNEETKMLFVLRNPEHLYVKEFLKLSAEDLLLVNPNTGTAPVFNSRRDMDLVLKIYRNNEVLLREYEDGRKDNPYGISVFTQFHMSGDSDKFVREQTLLDQGYKKRWIYYEKDGERYVPLCEGKTFYILDSRYNHTHADGSAVNASQDEKSDPHFFPRARYYIRDRQVTSFYRSHDWSRNWLIAFRDVTNATNERTFVSSIMSDLAFGHKAPIVLSERFLYVLSLLVSHVCDYVARQKIQGTSMCYFILYQLPVPNPVKFKELPALDEGYKCLEESVIRRLVKCVNYSYDMEPFVKDMGYEIEPRPWNEKKRLDYMAQLDAIAAQLYGIDYDDLRHIFTTFPIERRKQEKEYGTYMSRDFALKYYVKYEKLLGGAAE